jgi:hypothetical protein
MDATPVSPAAIFALVNWSPVATIRLISIVRQWRAPTAGDEKEL